MDLKAIESRREPDSDKNIYAKQKLLVCKMCDNRFETKQELRRHKDQTHKDTADVPCPICDKLFKSEMGMKTHENIHKETKLRCDICNLICVTKTRFNQHVRNHVEMFPKSCPICDKTFRKVGSLRLHQKAIHQKENCTFSCQSCPKRFQTRGKCKLHEKFAHSQLFDLECYICKKRSPTKNALSIHMTSHSDKKPHLPCPECGKLFNAKHLLRGHISRMHEFSTTTCDICLVTIKTIDLKIHNKTHAQKDIPNSHIKCEYCSQDHTIKNIKTHMKSHVLQEIKCEFCSKIFQQDEHLRKHVNSIHKQIQKKTCCNICSQTINSEKLQKHMAEVHMNERPFSCPNCSKTFKRRPHLRGHLILHSDTKPFKCEVCNNSFAAETSLRLHSFLHTNEKPYKCEKCEKAFRQPHHLKSHILSHHTGQYKEICNVCHKKLVNMKVHMRTHSSETYYSCEVCQEGFKYHPSFVSHKQRKHGTKHFKCKMCPKEYHCKKELNRHTKRIHPHVKIC